MGGLDDLPTPGSRAADHADRAGLPEVGAADRGPDAGAAGGMQAVAPRAVPHGYAPRPRSGFEGIPTGVLGQQLAEARATLRDAQSKADMIRRELKRRKKHTLR